jgi:hypothetical protein
MPPKSSLKRVIDHEYDNKPDYNQLGLQLGAKLAKIDADHNRFISNFKVIIPQLINGIEVGYTQELINHHRKVLRTTSQETQFRQSSGFGSSGFGSSVFSQISGSQSSTTNPFSVDNTSQNSQSSSSTPYVFSNSTPYVFGSAAASASASASASSTSTHFGQSFGSRPVRSAQSINYVPKIFKFTSSKELKTQPVDLSKDEPAKEINQESSIESKKQSSEES